MRILLGSLFGALLVLGAASVVAPQAGCSPAANHVAKNIIDVLLPGSVAKCVAENVRLDDDALQDACKYGDDLRPAVRQLKQAGLAGAARLYAPDAGK